MRTALFVGKKTLAPLSDCKECSNERSRRWYYENTERALTNHPMHILRQQVLEKLGGRCMNPNCLVPGGCTDPRALQLDHVNNDGAAERREYNIKKGPKGGQGEGCGFNRTRPIYAAALEDTEGRYQLLCANCNVIKAYEHKHAVSRGRHEAERQRFADMEIRRAS